MADFAPNFTARYIVRYSSLGLVHTNQFRIIRNTGASGLNAMIGKVTAFYNTLVLLRFTDWTIVSATYVAEDSNVSVPAAAPTVNAGQQPIPADPKSQAILSTSFVGRSNLGQKARLFVYGLNIGPEADVVAGDDFRQTSVENANVSAAIVVLNNGNPNIMGSDNAPVAWYSYVNTKYNDFHLRHARG